MSKKKLVLDHPRAFQPKFTPGPWAFERETVFAEGGALAHVLGYGRICCAAKTNEEVRANAALITAAPALLEALKGVLAIADRKTKAFDTAWAAIDKAEGRS